MNINVKLLLYTHKTYADGSHPIILQYTLNRKTKKKVIYKCLPADWDFKNNRVKSKSVNSAYINNLISTEFAKAEQLAFKVRQNEILPTKIFEKQEVFTLNDAFERKLSDLTRESKGAAYLLYKSIADQLKTFFNSEGTLLTSMNLSWFQRYTVFLSKKIEVDGHAIKRENSKVTVRFKVITVKGVIKPYFKNGLPEGVDDFKLKSDKRKKIKLSKEELQKIEQLDLSHKPNLQEARDIFLLQVYLRGARIGSIIQVYTWQFKEGRYTAVNEYGKYNVNANLTQKAQAIIDRYSGKNKRLFSVLRYNRPKDYNDFEDRKAMTRAKNSAIARVNLRLKAVAKMLGIDKNLTSHIARHSYARIAMNTIKNPMVTMELLGHADLKVHQRYLEDLENEDLMDQANNDVLNW